MTQCFMCHNEAKNPPIGKIGFCSDGCRASFNYQVGISEYVPLGGKKMNKEEKIGLVVSVILLLATLVAHTTGNLIQEIVSLLVLAGWLFVGWPNFVFIGNSDK